MPVSRDGWGVSGSLRLQCSPGLLVMLLEYPGGVRIGAFHVAIPFACSFHVFFRKSVVVEEHEFEFGVKGLFSS